MLSQHGAGRNTPANLNTPIYVAQRVIGYVRGDTFHKTITGSKHMLRQPRAHCFDAKTLRDAAAAGATRVEVYDRETTITYSATLATIDAHCFAVHRGCGNQVGVPLDHWSINGATPVAEQRAAATNRGREELQMSLFGEAG